jgi:hypothetical protein
VTGFDDVALQKPSGTDAHCSQQAAEMWILPRLLTVCAAVPHQLRLLWLSNKTHLHLNGFMYKKNMRFWASEHPCTVVEMSLHPAICTMWYTISKQGLTELIFVEGTITNQ